LTFCAFLAPSSIENKAKNDGKYKLNRFANVGFFCQAHLLCEESENNTGNWSELNKEEVRVSLELPSITADLL
jgi:hypothetical protein